jgi:predicted nucleotidyltransferase/DNA-binding XRE family transcriptional regulator
MEELMMIQRLLSETERDTLSKKIGVKLRKLREQSGLSQHNVGKRIGISRQAIHSIETGQTRLTIERFKRVLNALGYDFEIAISRLGSPVQTQTGHKKRLQAAIKAVEVLKNAAGASLEKVILYGSVARGDDIEGSDIDLIAVFNANPLSARKYREKVYGKLMDYLIENDIELSLQVFSVQQWKKSESSFFKKAKQEGVTLYESKS